MLDNRLAEEDFPVTPGVASAGPPGLTQETEELPLLDIPFMLTSFLLSQVTPVYPLCPLLTLTLSPQVLAHSLVSLLQSMAGSGLASLAAHLASLLLWTAQFVW